MVDPDKSQLLGRAVLRAASLTCDILIRAVVASASEVADNNSELALSVKICKGDASGVCEILWHLWWVISAVSDSTTHTWSKRRTGNGSYSLLLKILRLECKKLLIMAILINVSKNRPALNNAFSLIFQRSRILLVEICNSCCFHCTLSVVILLWVY